MKTDTVFRGCMRPAMFMGVPMMPFMLAFGVFTMPALYFSFWLILALPVSIFVMQQMVKYDEHVFDILFLRLKTNANARSAKKIGNSTVLLSPADSESK